MTKKDFKGQEYYDLLDYIFKEADTFEFTIAEENVKVNFKNILNKNRLEDAYSKYLDPLDEFLIEKKKTHRNLVKIFEERYKIHVFKYKAINRSKEIIKTFTNHAYGWDICMGLEYLTFYSGESELVSIVEDEDEIYFFNASLDTIFPKIKEHTDDWNMWEDE